MYSKHYFVFFDKTNDFTIDEFGNIGRTMEDGPFNSNEIGRHVDTETIFMVRENAEKLVNAWEALDVYYIGDNVIHLHGQPITNGCYFICDNQNRNKSNAPATHNEIKRHLWNVWASVQYLSYDQFNAGTYRVQTESSSCCNWRKKSGIKYCDAGCPGGEACKDPHADKGCACWVADMCYINCTFFNPIVNFTAICNPWNSHNSARHYLYNNVYVPRMRVSYDYVYNNYISKIDYLPYPK